MTSTSGVDYHISFRDSQQESLSLTNMVYVVFAQAHQDLTRARDDAWHLVSLKHCRMKPTVKRTVALMDVRMKVTFVYGSPDWTLETQISRMEAPHHVDKYLSVPSMLGNELFASLFVSRIWEDITVQQYGQRTVGYVFCRWNEVFLRGNVLCDKS